MNTNDIIPLRSVTINLVIMEVSSIYTYVQHTLWTLLKQTVDLQAMLNSQKGSLPAGNAQVDLESFLMEDQLLNAQQMGRQRADWVPVIVELEKRKKLKLMLILPEQNRENYPRQILNFNLFMANLVISTVQI